LKKVKELDSLYVPVYPELAELFFYSNRLAQAKEMYRIYLSLCDYDLDAMVRYASFLYLSKDYDNAIKEILKVQSKDTSYLVFNKFLGYSYYEVGKYAEGIAPLKKWIYQAPKEKIVFQDYEYYYKMLFKLGQYDLCMECMKTAYSMDTTKIEILAQIAEMLNKDADKVYKTYDSLYRMADTITKKADTALKTSLLRDAAVAFKQAADKYHEAANAYRSKIFHSLNPQAADYFIIGKDLYRAADYDNADAAFKSVNDIAPTYIPSYVFRVNINVYYKDTLATTGSAEAVCDTLIERLKTDTVSAAKNKTALMTCYKYLGTYYLKKKECRKGKEYYLKAKEIDPTDKQVLDILKGLNC
jgi:tetratricopeptide (TPR) repeat protein